jgi:hypothetical protein
MAFLMTRVWQNRSTACAPPLMFAFLPMQYKLQPI